MKGNINRFLRLFLQNYFLVIAVILFFIPFFWFSPGEIDLGGDSSRLYFFDPLSWLNNSGYYIVNTLNSLSTANPQFSAIPFLLFLLVIKKLMLNSGYFLNCAFSGLLLSGSFLFTYLSIKETVTDGDDKKGKFCAIVGALFFVFSPLVTDGWMKALYSFNQIFIYPLTFYLFIKYIKTTNLRYVLGAIISTLIFSVNFSFPTFPWFLAFFFFSLIFFFSYAKALGKTKIFFKGLVIFVPLFLAIHAFQLIPQIANVLTPTNPNNQAVFSKDLAVNRGLEYFLVLQAYTKLTYPLLNQVQFDLPKGIGAFEYGLKYRQFYYVYIFIILLGSILVQKNGDNREKKINSSLILVFLILAFLMSANITRYLANFYKSLFSVPGFSMFRSYYSKFGMSFTFFYAILLGFSLSRVFEFLRFNLLKIILSLYLLTIIIFNGWPLINGMIVNSILWQSNNVKLPTQMSENYLSFLDTVKQRNLDGRYLSLPLTNEEYQIVQGEKGGAYFGPSIISILGGKNDFAGYGSFNVFSKEIVNALSKKDINLLNKYFAFLNIRYIFHNSDDYVYVNFPSYPYATSFKDTFPTNYSIKEFINSLGYQEINKIKFMTTYINDDTYLSHFYIPSSIYKSGWPLEILTKIYSLPDFQIRSAVFFDYQNIGKMEKIFLATEDNSPFSKVQISPQISQSVLEYKKINPVKYKVVIHGARGKIPLVFLDIFDTNWKIYFVKKGKTILPIDDLLKNINNMNYSLSKYNYQDQASLDEVKEYISKGWVSDLGGNNKNNSQINFISKNFNGTIQNDNLLSGFLLDTILKKKKYKQLSEINHLQVNGYANSWLIDTEEICKDLNFCIKNNDGSFDFEMIIEFWQQRLFYYGSVITFLSIFVCLIFFLNKKKVIK